MTDDDARTADTAADRMLTKLREFSAALDVDERAALAALIGPGVALAHGGGLPPATAADDDVTGFDHEPGTGRTWTPSRLPTALSDALNVQGIRVVGLDPS
jgi:hypothetical protein